MNQPLTQSRTEITTQALEGLDTVAEDISMIASGRWIPDEEDCACSLETIKRVRALVIDLSN